MRSTHVCQHKSQVNPKHGELTFAVASSEPLTSNGGPLRSGQQLLTKLSCSLIFFTWSRNSKASSTELNALLDNIKEVNYHSSFILALLRALHKTPVQPSGSLNATLCHLCSCSSCLSGMLAVTRRHALLRGCTDLLPCGNVPRAHGAVWGCTEDALAICGPLHLQHSILVPCMAQSALTAAILLASGLLREFHNVRKSAAVSAAPRSAVHSLATLSAP